MLPFVSIPSEMLLETELTHIQNKWKEFPNEKFNLLSEKKDLGGKQKKSFCWSVVLFFVFIPSHLHGV